MSGYVLLEQIEAVDDVLQRWHKEVDFLQAVAQAKKIPFFYRQETRIRPTDGMMVHFCLQFDSLRCIDSARHLYKTDGFFLRSEDIKTCEQTYPELLWEPAYPEDALMQKYGEYIPADVVRKWLRMSPMTFIDFMNRGQGPVSSWEEAFRDHLQNLYPEHEFFSVSDLQKKEFAFHVLDWLEWQNERNSQEHTAPEPPPALADSSTASPQEKEARILALEEQLNARDARIVELEDLLEAQGQQIATLEQGPVDAQRWRNNIAAVCGLLVSIMQEARTDWIRDEFTTALAEACPRYLTDVERIAWKALPDSCKHGRGRKKKI